MGIRKKGKRQTDHGKEGIKGTMGGRDSYNKQDDGKTIDV